MRGVISGRREGRGCYGKYTVGVKLLTQHCLHCDTSLNIVMSGGNNDNDDDQ